MRKLLLYTCSAFLQFAGKFGASQGDAQFFGFEQIWQTIR